MFLKKRNIISHWALVSSPLSQEGVIFAARLHVAGKNSVFLWTDTAGAVVMGKVGWEEQLCGVTAMAGQHREGTLGATMVLCCGQRALCICERNSRRERTQKQGMIPDIEGGGIRAIFL